MQPVLLSTVMGWMRSSGFSDGASFSDDASSSGNSVADFELTGFASVEKAGPADVCFWAGTTQKSETNAFGISEAALSQIRAGLIFVPDNLCMDAAAFKKMLPQVKCVVPVKNPYHVMVEFLKEFVESRDAAAIAESRDVANLHQDVAAIADCGIAASAKVHPTAVVEGNVGENAVVGPNCVIMAGATVGANCKLEANVTIYPNVIVGEGCVFQAGVVIGSRGFGFYEYEGERRMVPHLAGARIGNGCSFGANTVVAAGFVSPTTIGNNCHFDSFVQIAHNCVLGNNIYMASQSGIAGTVTVEDDVEFAGGAQSAGHLTIGKGARIAAKAGVTKSVPAGKTVAGFPAVDIEKWRRSVVRLRMMDK